LFLQSNITDEILSRMETIQRLPVSSRHARKDGSSSLSLTVEYSSALFDDEQKPVLVMYTSVPGSDVYYLQPTKMGSTSIIKNDRQGNVIVQDHSPVYVVIDFNGQKTSEDSVVGFQAYSYIRQDEGYRAIPAGACVVSLRDLMRGKKVQGSLLRAISRQGFGDPIATDDYKGMVEVNPVYSGQELMLFQPPFDYTNSSMRTTLTDIVHAIVNRNHMLYDPQDKQMRTSKILNSNRRMNLILAKFFENPIQILPTEMYFMAIGRPDPEPSTVVAISRLTLDKHAWSEKRFVSIVKQLFSAKPLDIEQMMALDLVSDMIFIHANAILYGADYGLFTSRNGQPVRTVVEQLGDGLTTLVDDCEGLFKIMGDLAFYWREKMPRKNPVVAAVQDILREYVFFSTLRSVTASNMRKARNVGNIDSLNSVDGQRTAKSHLSGTFLPVWYVLQQLKKTHPSMRQLPRGMGYDGNRASQRTKFPTLIQEGRLFSMWNIYEFYLGRSGFDWRKSDKMAYAAVVDPEKFAKNLGTDVVEYTIPPFFSEWSMRVKCLDAPLKDDSSLNQFYRRSKRFHVVTDKKVDYRTPSGFVVNYNAPFGLYRENNKLVQGVPSNYLVRHKDQFRFGPTPTYPQHIWDSMMHVYGLFKPRTKMTLPDDNEWINKMDSIYNNARTTMRDLLGSKYRDLMPIDIGYKTTDKCLLVFETQMVYFNVDDFVRLIKHLARNQFVTMVSLKIIKPMNGLATLALQIFVEMK
jgi:hypothetical protein